MPQMHDPHDYKMRPFFEKLRRRRLAAGFVVALENASLSLWRLLFWGLFFAGLWLLEIPAMFGRFGPGVFLAAFAGGLILFALRDLRTFRWPDRRAIDRRLETDSKLPHRPLEVLEDRLANPYTPPARHLWDKARSRSLDLIAALRTPRPRPLIAQNDRYALRIAVLLLLVMGLTVAGPEGPQRIKAGLVPYNFLQETAHGAAITLWITPPAYTRLPRIVLEGRGAADKPLSVPAGSQFKLRVTNGIGHQQLKARPSSGLICRGSETKFFVRPCPIPKKSPIGVSTLGFSSPSHHIRSRILRRANLSSHHSVIQMCLIQPAP